jgi:hypothetical protein
MINKKELLLVHLSIDCSNSATRYCAMGSESVTRVFSESAHYTEVDCRQKAKYENYTGNARTIFQALAVVKDFARVLARFRGSLPIRIAIDQRPESGLRLSMLNFLHPLVMIGWVKTFHASNLAVPTLLRSELDP